MNIDNIFCPNKNCKHYKQINAGNLKIKQYQGKVQKIALLQCLSCGTIFSEKRGTIYFRLHCKEKDFNNVMRCLMTRMSIREIVRLTGVYERKIYRWILKAGEFMKDILDFKIKKIQLNECQLDEMWTFVKMKTKTADRKGIKNKKKIGEQWIFIAFDPESKLLIHFKIGKRTKKTAKLFIKELKRKLGNMPLFMTDEWNAYEQAFLLNYSTKIIPQKPKGKRRTRGMYKTKPRFKVDKSLKLTQVHKMRENSKVVDIKQKVIFGTKKEIQEIINSSSVSNVINTSFVERNNGTIRALQSRVVRATYSFSKKLEMLIAHFTIYAVYYNFCWVHSRLKTTAAILYGLTDKVYKIEEFFKIRDFEFI